MAATTFPRRNAKANAAAERAAKERRQLYMVVGLGALLLIVLAVEVLPKVLHSSSAPPAAAPAPTPVVSTPTATAQTAAGKAALRHVLRQPARDPFVGRVPSVPTALGNVPGPAGVHDPFSEPGSASSTVSVPVQQAPVQAIQGTIVIGTPGAGAVKQHGWIVILASLPTSKGRAAATAFAAKARRNGAGSVSILNSSNRRPLRGGYWVVYSGPYATLGEVDQHAAAVHSHGFASAYVRQLIVYRKK
jgi:hypothetical protein